MMNDITINELRRRYDNIIFLRVIIKLIFHLRFKLVIDFIILRLTMSKNINIYNFYLFYIILIHRQYLNKFIFSLCMTVIRYHLTGRLLKSMLRLQNGKVSIYHQKNR